MLPTTLNTNEIKGATGVELEFDKLSSGERQIEFALRNESPSFHHRLTVKHSESGSGVDTRRRSVCRFDLEGLGDIDTSKKIRNSAYLVLDIPVGNMAGYDATKTVLANLLSFCATTGAATTVLFDGTGTGAQVLLSGGL